MSTVCVLGGGVAGLSAAHYALKLPSTTRVIMMEATDRLGGWVRTTRHEDGVIYEAGPRTIRPMGERGANTLALVQELKLEDKVRPVMASSASASNRLLLVEGNLHKLPSSLSSLFYTIPPFSRPLCLSVLRDLFTAKKTCDDESLDEFVTRRLGAEVAEYLVAPLVRGICAGDSKLVSVHFIASYLHSLEQRAGSITLGVLGDLAREVVRSRDLSEEEPCDLVVRARQERWAVWGLQGGLHTLVEQLGCSLRCRGVEIRTKAEVTSLTKDGARMVVWTGEEEVACDHLILATPSHVSASLLSPFSDRLCSLLSSIPHVSVALVNLEYRGKDLQGAPGFGFLVPPSQPQQVLGCIYDTCTFAQGDRTVLTVMLGGAWYSQVVGDKTEAEVTRLAEEEVSQILGIRGPPVRTATHLLPNCIAQYTVGHRARVSEARRLLAGLGPRVSVVGSSYDGVGINDTIASSRACFSL